MKTAFQNLEWHDTCAKKLAANHQRGGLMIVYGAPGAGKHRFFANLHAKLHDLGPIIVFRCPPCGTERDVLTRLGRKLGIEEFRAAEPKSELTIAERIASAIPSGSTLVLNDAHLMTPELVKSILFIRKTVTDEGGNLAIVFGATYSPVHMRSLGVPGDEVGIAYHIPDLSRDQVLRCLKALCPGRTDSLVKEHAEAPSSPSTVAALFAVIARVGLLAEFASIAASPEYCDVDLKESVRRIIEGMGHDCRVTIPSMKGSQAEFAF